MQLTDSLIQNRSARPGTLLTLLLAAFPLLLLLVFYTYVLRARLFLGHWPSYDQPDPKQLGWWIQHSFLQLGFIGFPAVALVATIFAIVGRTRSRDFPVWSVIAIAVGACGVLIGVARLDPGDFMQWFWD